ncbi:MULTISPECIES: phosphoribulokinase [Mycobacteriaceae]|uniref:phosphoribulokinase n=1 Tax=[Mycobacterium] wendilense TaxID=3064284 RepID=A0ABM9MG32_9MYCO|nr:MULTISPECIES: phosphoribulokinase [Mycolicibacterium]CAJ1584336.1 phosphoribulokinase [Mycolicibacterium sp. MU0050]
MMLAIAGDSASGKSTVAAGLVNTLGPHRCLSISTDDYHRFDRLERSLNGMTPLHPDCNHLDILGQHLQLLATGQSVLKPVYDHASGRLLRPVVVDPADYIIVEGLLPLHTNLCRACFDLAVYLDPDDNVRRDWKTQRDCASRGYTPDQVLTELADRESDAQQFVLPQRAFADLVVRFAPIEQRNDPPDTPLSATLLLRPNIPQPDLTSVLRPEITATMHMGLANDHDGRPVDSLHVHGYVDPEESARAEKLLWRALTEDRLEMTDALGAIAGGHSTPLAVTQMMLLFHLLKATR